MSTQDASIVPSLYVKREGESTTKAELRLTSARERFVVRFTGGCGFMSKADAQGLYDLFKESFEGFAGALLFGGTRMLEKQDTSIVVPGITEIPPVIWKDNPESSILGIIPKSQDLRISQLGMVIHDEEGATYTTIVHPDQAQCLVVQQSADEGVDWEAEFKECLRIINDLRSFAQWESLLVSYNGGGVTEKEILATASRGWPVLLINGSGRISEQYANDKAFLKKYPLVHVAEKSVDSIRGALLKIGALKARDVKSVPYLQIVGEETP